jgi:DNA-binding beta-propeller fold protein YncE
MPPRPVPGFRKAVFALISVLLLRPTDGLCAQPRTATGMLASGFAANIIAVNPVTNKIYVGCFALSPDDEEPGGQFQVSAPLVVVDGATGATTILSEDLWTDLQVNAVTNTVYGADGGTAIIVVDGTTNAVTRVPTPAAVYEVCVNPVTNAVYGVGGQNVVTVVDGTTHAVSEVVVGGDRGEHRDQPGVRFERQ